MDQPLKNDSLARPPVLIRSLTLMKPITWFAPVWAFLCGAIASGGTSLTYGGLAQIVLGMIFAGPIMCGLSQVINDYFDREVDAINEPDRLIPSGMVSIQQVMLTIVALSVAAVVIAALLGRGVLLLTGIGMLTAVAYSAPPIRGKRNGWYGNTLVAISYEGLAWLAGHLAFAALTPGSLLIAVLYSFATHGIMSINDYKSIDGDREIGIRTIPVQYGPQRTAWLILATMNLAQFGVIAAFVFWQSWVIVAALIVVFLIQLPMQRFFLKDPIENYLRFSAIGVSFFVWGMLVAAIGLRTLS